MQFMKKIPGENKKRTKELLSSGWNRLKEPSNLGIAILYSLPISIILMTVNGIWLFLLSPVFKSFINSDGFIVEFQISIKSLGYILAVILFLLIHELIHALFVPGVFHSPCTYWGFNGGFGFVYTEEIMTKKRFMLISIMPLLLLSYILPAVLLILGISNWFIIILCIINAGGSCVDILNMFLIAGQVSQNGTIVNNGYSTYFKNAE